MKKSTVILGENEVGLKHVFFAVRCAFREPQISHFNGSDPWLKKPLKFPFFFQVCPRGYPTFQSIACKVWAWQKNQISTDLHFDNKNFRKFCDFAIWSLVAFLRGYPTEFYWVLEVSRTLTFSDNQPEKWGTFIIWSEIWGREGLREMLDICNVKFVVKDSRLKFSWKY